MAARRAVRDATNLLTATPDEAAIIIACALHSAQDLLSLARACRRFAIKCIAAPAAHRNATTAVAAAAQQAEICPSQLRPRADGSPTAPTRSAAGCRAAVGRAGWV